MSKATAQQEVPVPAPTDRQRAEMYRAEISRLTAELNAVRAQRDSLLGES